MKTVDEMAQLVERPDVQRKVLQDYQENYRGPFSLGVTEKDGRPVLLLRVQGVHDPIWRAVQVDGDRVPVIIEAGFVPPRPL
jgi:malate synthase